MGKTICVTNQKGGVGKTTTVINLGCSLAAAQKTLIIDLDPQANATSGVGIDKNESETTVYDVLLGKSDIRTSIKKVHQSILNDYLFLCPSNAELTGAEIELIGIENREWKLKQAISEIVLDFDYILIDCPPSLNLLTINSLAAADSVLIPVQCEYYALEGLSQLNRTINLIKERLNSDIQVEGYLLTLFDSRNRLSSVIVNEVRTYFEDKVFDTIIPRNVRLAECPSHGLPILLYDATSKGAQSYISLAREIIENNNGGYRS
ncbi:MAG: AAA family ATPase [Candidatus Dadabacteria bacterium]|nr:AAA family ATPase [Candidatus Dadabacteria bacterium]NIX16677.1 AAA family ATPase [Candidatus Dadabacteria bacterium]